MSAGKRNRRQLVAQQRPDPRKALAVIPAAREASGSGGNGRMRAVKVGLAALGGLGAGSLVAHQVHSRGEVTKRLKAVSKGALPTLTNQFQARDPFGRFASTGNKLDVTHLHARLKTDGACKVGHGRSKLAPTTTRRRDGHGYRLGPNGASYGRRLGAGR